MQRHDRAAAAVRDAVDRLALQVALRDIPGAVGAGLHQIQLFVEALLGELALGDAVGTPHLVAVHRAHLAGQPGDRRHHEIAVGIDVKHVAHVALRIADAMLGAQPCRRRERRAQRLGAVRLRHLLRGSRERGERGVNRVQASPSKSWTCTCSPAFTAARSCSSTMKQFASDIERSTPEPCWPVVRTFHRSWSLKTTPLWYSVRPGTFLRFSAATALSIGSGSSFLPERCMSASRTNS